MNMTKSSNCTLDALIALGANQPGECGTPLATLTRGLSLLADQPGIVVKAVSRWFSTPAFPPGSGPDFLNGAAVLGTEFDPPALLSVLHGIEAKLGRKRAQRWGPRVCDLDLLAWGDKVLPDTVTARHWMDLPADRARSETPERLILPHPRLHERAFVLVPLADVAPGWRHPLTGKTIREMLEKLPADERGAVIPLGPGISGS